MKHAWLIIAHNEFDILQKLVSAIDYPQCDVFIHFDRKVSVLPTILVKESRLYILSERIDVRWGSVSQIKCELALFQEASQQGPYDYYHMISGVTLPLKRFDDIDAFFQATMGKSVLTGLCHDTPYQETLKVRRYNLFLRNYTSSNRFLRGASQLGWKSAIALQRILHIEANRNRSFYKASNWLSLTEEAVQFILNRRRVILKTYQWSFCGDEYFVPSELMTSSLRENVLNSDNYLLRKIQRDTASVYRLNEMTSLAEQGYLFARKFTSRL